ncbi:MAG: methyltransferase [Pseudorhodoplanes sp.]|nr:methyltransferase [Pseudorhodoplanes sp.]GIK83087.1 MAG: putative RNA methyltransferase [Alphaproteobacteria bacterium]
MTERLTIVRLGHRGDGVADTPQGAIYTPYTLPGETVEVEPVPGHPDRRHLLRVVTPSGERIPAICAHFGVCGGCAIQHWTLERYREWKRSLVVAALDRAGLNAAVEPLIDAHGEGRRRATFHARRGTKDILEVGFAALRAHTLVPIEACPVLTPALAGAIPAAWAIAETLEGTGKPLDIQMTATDNGLDVDVRGSGTLPAEATARLARLAKKHDLARITRHGELVVRRALPSLRMGRATVILPPGSFLQATMLGEETLARLVTDAARRARSVADLFCGVGPFSLRLAESTRITAVDSDAPALDSLQAAARAAPGLRPVGVLRRDLFRRPLTAPELKAFDAVVFDPPRQGGEAQAAEIAKSKVPLVIAVSCNPTTFARDARLLVEGGYRPGTVIPVDQFKYSAHVELVASFTR